MADIIIPSSAASVFVPLQFQSQLGRIQSKGPSGGSVSTSDATKLTVALSADGGTVILTPVAAGTGVTVTYTNGSLSASMLVDVAVLQVTTVVFNITGAIVNAPSQGFVS